MPKQNEHIISEYQNEAELRKNYAKLAKKITDVVLHKIGGLTADDPEYWGLREMLTPEMVDMCNKMKLRKHYTLDDLIKLHKGVDPKHIEEVYDQMSVIGIIEYDYGDNYTHNHEDDHPIPNAPKIKRYRLPFFVPGSAELFNSSLDRIERNPAVTSFFERMTFIPLAGITHMVAPGGMGIGMHVILVEKAIESRQESISLEKISYWLTKYEGHIAAGICSCRASRAVLGDGCTDDVNDWCVQLGDAWRWSITTVSMSSGVAASMSICIAYTPGWFALIVSTARRQWFMAISRNVSPRSRIASANPVENPPAPQYRSRNTIGRRLISRLPCKSRKP